MTVISLADRRKPVGPEADSPHISGEAKCIQCQHQWVAVASVGVTWMECPSCGLHKGAFIHPCMVPVGETRWECRCGSALFYITPKAGPTCHGCGLPATGWFGRNR